VLAEIDTVQREYGAREVYFDDDDFTVDREAVFNLCSEINNRGLKIPWSCMADAINTDEEMIKVMAESGCIGIKFGVESGSRRILKKIGKPLSLKKVNNLVNLCRDYGIKSHAAFLFGLLDEKDKDLMDSINYIKQLKSDSVQISVATPYPGTRFYAALKNRGLLSNKNRKYYDGRTSDKIELVRLKKRVLLLWFIGKWCSLELIAHNLFIFYRTLRGLGVKIFITKLKAVILDEMKNR
jgi:anaerobic magnesium-protoporphyrin IX monomethyl ester cyclase